MTNKNKSLLAALFGLSLLLTTSVGVSYYAFYSGGKIGLLTLAPMLLYFIASMLFMKPPKSLGYASLGVSGASYFAFFGFTGIPYGLTYTILIEVIGIITAKYLRRFKTA